jgi:hypothetical protein
MAFDSNFTAKLQLRKPLLFFLLEKRGLMTFFGRKRAPGAIAYPRIPRSRSPIYNSGAAP